MLVKASDLRMLDVVNICDGRRLGYICDVDVDVQTGEIRALILPGSSGWLGMNRRPDIEIPWNRIKKIGVDVILVDIPEVAEGGFFQRGS